MKKILLSLALTTLALGAVAADSMQSGSHNWNQGAADSAGTFKAIVATANAERKLAKKLGFEWRDIGKFLKQAKKLHKKGDTAGALKLVSKAKKQAILGQQQARDQANAGPKF